MSEQDKAFDAIEAELGCIVTTLIAGKPQYQRKKLRAALDAYIDARIEAKQPRLHRVGVRMPSRRNPSGGRSVSHAPTPWTVEPNPLASMENLIQCKEAGWTVATVHDDREGCGWNGGNSEFIVRACNSHEALVKALRAMVAAADSDGWNECGPLIDARAAIRLAEGEKP